jgi:GMP synthase (glutamine-hydrolysing)
MTRVIVVQHSPAGGPGRLAEWLAEDGLALDVVRAYDGAQLPDHVASHAGVIVLGGGYMPDADDLAPWLPRTRALVADALKDDVPVFGICLGGQLLAHVAGGEVRAAHGQPEAGSTPLTIRPEAEEDALFHGLPARVMAIEHRIDAITDLPPGARWLAQSERCPIQAFRVGGSAWGVQFHPEVTAERITEWDREQLRRQGFDRDELFHAARRDEAASAQVWREVARRFAAVVADRARTPRASPA